MMRSSLYLALTALTLVALVGILPLRADALAIQPGDFGPGAQITTFDGLPLPFGANPAPLVIDGHSITTDSGNFRYVRGPLCFSGDCVGNDTGAGFIDVVLSQSYTQVGAYVRAAQDSWSIQADFFDASDVLVGSTVVTGGTALEFAGWEDVGGISRIRYTDLNPNDRIEVLDNLTVAGARSVVPEPSSALLTAIALGAVHARARRRKR